MGYQVPKQQEFLTRLKYGVYSILSDISEETSTPKVEAVYEPSKDTYNEYYRVTWESKDKNCKYQVQIKVQDIGPARYKDFMDRFKEELQEEYPELLL